MPFRIVILTLRATRRKRKRWFCALRATVGGRWRRRQKSGDFWFENRLVSPARRARATAWNGCLSLKREMHVIVKACLDEPDRMKCSAKWECLSQTEFSWPGAR